MIESTRSRLQTLSNYIENGLVFRSKSQTIFSPTAYMKPITVGSNLKIVQIDSHFKLNDVEFDHYIENSRLMRHGDQVLTISGSLTFQSGLLIDKLEVEHVNGVNIVDAIKVMK